MVILDSLPYGFDADGTLPMDLGSDTLPAEVAIALEREPEQVDSDPEISAADGPEAEEPVPLPQFFLTLRYDISGMLSS